MPAAEDVGVPDGSDPLSYAQHDGSPRRRPPAPLVVAVATLLLAAGLVVALLGPW